MVQSAALFNNPNSELSLGFLGDVYQQLTNVSSTTISFQYNPKKFLSFKVYEASQGAILRQTLNNKDEIALKCKIRGTAYTLTQEHLDQLSNRERRELFNHLRIDESQFR